MRTKVHRHELEDMPVSLDATLEGCAALVVGERDRRDWAAWIADRHGEAGADAKLHRSFKKPLPRL
jgi:hypothetical protein